MLSNQRFGDTGLTVSVLGLGAGQIGMTDVPEATASDVLNGALDLGITLIDTAASYGLSEERIGRHLGHRRTSTMRGSASDPTGPAQPDGSARRLPNERLSHGHFCPEGSRRGSESRPLSGVPRPPLLGVPGKEYGGSLPASSRTRGVGYLGSQ
jgi:hypothetical protein